MTRERIEFPDGKHVPRKSRARLRWPLRLSAPRCPVCREWEHPDYDHSACKEES